MTTLCASCATLAAEARVRGYLGFVPCETCQLRAELADEKLKRIAAERALESRLALEGEDPEVAAFIKHVYREMFRVGMLALSEPREAIPFGDV